MKRKQKADPWLKRNLGNISIAFTVVTVAFFILVAWIMHNGGVDPSAAIVLLAVVTGILAIKDNQKRGWTGIIFGGLVAVIILMLIISLSSMV